MAVSAAFEFSGSGYMLLRNKAADVQDLINGEIERMLNDPGLAHLIINKE